MGDVRFAGPVKTLGGLQTIHLASQACSAQTKQREG